MCLMSRLEKKEWLRGPSSFWISEESTSQVKHCSHGEFWRCGNPRNMIAGDGINADHHLDLGYLLPWVSYLFHEDINSIRILEFVSTK